jgi:hypothetical protein
MEETEQIVVEWHDGVPYCTDEQCPKYDGKRCELLGHRPCRVCEIEVRSMDAKLKSLRRIHIAHRNALLNHEMIYD